MLIFEKEFKLLIQTYKFFEEIENICELEKIKTKVKLKLYPQFLKENYR